MELKDIMIIIVLISLVTTLAFGWIMEGSLPENYNRTVSRELNSSLNNITAQLDVMSNKTKDIEEQSRKISTGGIENIFLVPKQGFNIFSFIMDSINSIFTIGTNLLIIIGIPSFVVTALEIMILLVVIFLIIGAIIKWRT
jgi:hypothetical protein